MLGAAAVCPQCDLSCAAGTGRKPTQADARLEIKQLWLTPPEPGLRPDGEWAPPRAAASTTPNPRPGQRCTRAPWGLRTPAPGRLPLQPPPSTSRGKFQKVRVKDLQTHPSSLPDTGCRTAWPWWQAEKRGACGTGPTPATQRPPRQEGRPGRRGWWCRAAGQAECQRHQRLPLRARGLVARQTGGLDEGARGTDPTQGRTAGAPTTG